MSNQTEYAVAVLLLETPKDTTGEPGKSVLFKLAMQMVHATSEDEAKGQAVSTLLQLHPVACVKAVTAKQTGTLPYGVGWVKVTPRAKQQKKKTTPR